MVTWPCFFGSHMVDSALPDNLVLALCMSFTDNGKVVSFSYSLACCLWSQRRLIGQKNNTENLNKNSLFVIKYATEICNLYFIGCVSAFHNVRERRYLKMLHVLYVHCGERAALGSLTHCTSREAVSIDWRSVPPVYGNSQGEFFSLTSWRCTTALPPLPKSLICVCVCVHPSLHLTLSMCARPPLENTQNDNAGTLNGAALARLACGCLQDRRLDRVPGAYKCNDYLQDRGKGSVPFNFYQLVARFQSLKLT